MMLLIILLILSAGINLVLIFMLVRRYDEAKLNIVSAEGPDRKGVEYFDLQKSNSVMY